jgi:putative DNA primase/helicase
MQFNQDAIELCFERHPKTGEILEINNRMLAELITEQIPVACIIETKEILGYFEGKYIRNGTEFIHRALVKILSPYTRSNGQTCYNTHVLKEVVDIIKGMNYHQANEFDKDLEIINCRNGLLNWVNGDFTPHTKDYLSRVQIPIDYDPMAACPFILQMLETVLEKKDRTKALEFAAYCLYRKHPIQKTFFMLGPGGTGKSHFMDVIRLICGENNVSSVSLHDLELDRFATSDLYCSLLNEFGDLEQTELKNVNTLKMLTSNKDIIRAQRKGEKSFEFINYAKLIFASNKLPRVRDNTSGFYRRIEILPFEHEFTRAEIDESNRTGLLQKIKSPEELSGFLNIILPYLAPLIVRGEFTNGFDRTTAKDKYKRRSEPVASFVELHLEEMADECASKHAIYEAYKAFCRKEKIPPDEVLHQVPFGKALRYCMPWWTSSVKEIDGVRCTCLINTRLNW